MLWHLIRLGQQEANRELNAVRGLKSELLHDNKLICVEKKKTS